MLAIGDDDLHSVDVRGSTPCARHRCREDGGGHPLAARHEQIERAWLEVAQDRDRSAQVTILACGGIDRAKEGPPCRTRRKQRFHHLPVAFEERRRQGGRLGALAFRRSVRPAEEEIRDPPERRRNDDQRSGVPRDQRGRALYGGRIRERCAAEFPYFEFLHGYMRLSTRGNGFTTKKRRKRRLNEEDNSYLIKKYGLRSSFVTFVSSL